MDPGPSCLKEHIFGKSHPEHNNSQGSVKYVFGDILKKRKTGNVDTQGSKKCVFGHISGNLDHTLAPKKENNE